jgi:integrase
MFCVAASQHTNSFRGSALVALSASIQAFNPWRFSYATLFVRLIPTNFPTVANIAKRGDKWRAEVCIDRNRKAKTFQTKREAITWSNEMEQTGIRPSKTLSDFISEYTPIAEAHKGYVSELSRLRQLDKALGDFTLDRLTPLRISTYRDQRLREVSPVSVRRELIILSAMLEIAVNEWQWLPTNPLKTVTKPTVGPSRRRGITQVEIDAILSNLKRLTLGKQVADMFLLSIESGMRLGEILSLRWPDVSEKSVTLLETKNGDRRKVPLSLVAREIIAGRVGLDSEKVFTLTADQASKTFARASVNGCHFHDARSEAITRLSKKLDVMQLARVVGHRDTRSLMFYYAESADSIADRL